MIVQCPTCFALFDDEFRLTICPHDTFAANDGQNNFAHHPESYLSEIDIVVGFEPRQLSYPGRSVKD